MEGNFVGQPPSDGLEAMGLRPVSLACCKSRVVVGNSGIHGLLYT